MECHIWSELQLQYYSKPFYLTMLTPNSNHLPLITVYVYPYVMDYVQGHSVLQQNTNSTSSYELKFG